MPRALFARMRKALFTLIGFLLLLKISPLGAVVAVVTCCIRQAFKSGAVSHFAGALMHDMARALWHRAFGPPQVRVLREPPRPPAP